MNKNSKKVTNIKKLITLIANYNFLSESSNEKKKQLQKIKKTIEENPDLINQADGTILNYTPLMYSIRESNYEIFKFLLNNGAEISIGNGDVTTLELLYNTSNKYETIDNNLFFNEFKNRDNSFSPDETSRAKQFLKANTNYFELESFFDALSKKNKVVEEKNKEIEKKNKEIEDKDKVIEDKDIEIKIYKRFTKLITTNKDSFFNENKVLFLIFTIIIIIIILFVYIYNSKERDCYGDIIKDTLNRKIQKNKNFCFDTLYYPNKNRYSFRKYQKKKLNLYIEWYKNKNKKLEINYNNNNLNSVHTSYYEDGTLKKEQYYQNDILNGNFKVYYHGILIEEGFYKDAKLDGKYKLYYKNGSLKEERTYKNGRLVIHFVRYDKDQNKTDEVKNNVYTEYDKGIKQYEIPLKKSQKLEHVYYWNKKDKLSRLEELAEDFNQKGNYGKGLKFYNIMLKIDPSNERTIKNIEYTKQNLKDERIVTVHIHEKPRNLKVKEVRIYNIYNPNFKESPSKKYIKFKEYVLLRLISSINSSLNTYIKNNHDDGTIIKFDIYLDYKKSENCKYKLSTRSINKLNLIPYYLDIKARLKEKNFSYKGKCNFNRIVVKKQQIKFLIDKMYDDPINCYKIKIKEKDRERIKRRCFN